MPTVTRVGTGSLGGRKGSGEDSSEGSSAGSSEGCRDRAAAGVSESRGVLRASRAGGEDSMIDEVGG